MIATVRTERLVLRPLVPGDAAALHAAFSDPILMHWWSSGPHGCVAETERHVARALADTKARI